jgi:alkylation response protein AidB-like acyl-CoA dehydrogenase
MTLVLSDEQRMLSESVQSFLEDCAPVAHLRKLRDSRDATGFSRDLWRDFAGQGYSGVMVPETHSGLGLGVVEAGLISERLGHTLTPTPFLSTAVMAAWVISRAGSAAQQERLLPRIAAAETVVAVAVDECSKHRPAVIATRATRDGTGFVLDGSKRFVLDGHVADTLIVAARTGPDAVTLFLVEASASGVEIERTFMVDAHNAARVGFSDVRIGAEAVLGVTDGGGALLEQLLDVGRAVVAAQLLGVADEAFDRTVAYLKERKQFNRPIGEFQALQHRAAQLYCDLELTRAIVLKALQAVQREATQSRVLVSQAKSRACTTASRAVQEGVQMHGGIGMTDDLDMGLFMKRARVLQELFGDAGFHADRIATLGGY